MSIRLAAAVLAAAALLASSCGGEDDDDAPTGPTSSEVNAERLRIIKAEVRRGELPPVTLRLFRLDGSPTFAQIGEGGDDHVIRAKANGTRGPKLRWDLDQDGEISADEREITARELYDATLPALDEAQRRLTSPPEGSEQS